MKTKAKEAVLLADRELGERILRRLYKYVVKSSTCWLWIGRAKTHGGYGKLNVNGIVLRAHRIAWMMAHGAITGDKIVCHSCDNPLCVNPVHLFLGTHKDNTQDMYSKGRASPPPFHPPGDNHPRAKLTEGQVAEIRSSDDSHAELGRKYGISDTSIARIRLGKQRLKNAG